MSLTKVTNSMIQDAWINVKDYGAVGNGSTNDSAAINLAIAALPNNGTLYFPAGTYLVSNATVKPTSNSTWWISPQATLTNVTTDVQYDIFIIDNINNFTMCGGGTIQGYVANNTYDNAICVDITNDDTSIVYTYNILIENIQFINSNGECIFIGSGGGASAGVRNIVVRNCKISGARRNGIAIGAANFVTIENNEIYGTYNPDHPSTAIQSGIDIEPLAGQYATNINITENYLHDNYGCGITIYGENGSSGAEVISNVIVERNFFNNNCIAGVSITSTLKASLEITTTLKVSVINNILTGLNKRGGISVDTNREAIIIGNQMTGDGASASQTTSEYFLSGITISACNRLQVSSNVIRNSNYHGIYLYQNNSPGQIIVSNNIIDICLVGGILSYSNLDCEIDENIFAQANTFGIYSLNDNYCNFLNNRIIDNNVSGLLTTNLQGAAIVVTLSSTNTPTNIKVMGNTVRTPTTTPTYPLIIQGSGVTNCVACPNDFRGTFVNGVTNNGTGTILSQTEVINLT